MAELVTVDTILNWLQEKIENKEPVAPGVYVEAAQKLNVLLSDEHARLFDLQQKVAQLKTDLIKFDGKSVAQSKTFIEATDTYREMQTQKAKIGRIEEFIRIAKISARLKDNEMRGY